MYISADLKNSTIKIKEFEHDNGNAFAVLRIEKDDNGILLYDEITGKGLKILYEQLKCYFEVNANE